MSLLDRFEDKYIPITEMGCWIWMGVLRNGYGGIRVTSNPADSLEGAHRVSYKLFKGEIPDKLYVCHKCDVPSCVNPDHLFLGTAKDNMQDALNKGKLFWKGQKRNFPKGSNHKQAKLTESDVKEIRESTEPGINLAKRYGVSNNVISRIRLHKIWRHI